MAQWKNRRAPCSALHAASARVFTDGICRRLALLLAARRGLDSIMPTHLLTGPPLASGVDLSVVQLKPGLMTEQHRQRAVFRCMWPELWLFSWKRFRRRLPAQARIRAVRKGADPTPDFV